MKRLPLIFSLLAVIALSASAAYWFIELNKPAQRRLAPIVQAAAPEPSADAAATLFGGQAVTVAVSNYQLTGVVSAGAQGVAILVADGQPAKAVAVGKEIAPGVIVKEVHPKHVMLSEGGIVKRIDLATDDKAGTSLAGGMAPPPMDPGQQQLQMQMQMQQQQQQMQMQQQQQQMQPLPVQPQELPGAQVPVPPNQPMEVPPPPPGVPAPPPPTQMPTPTRTMGADSNNLKPTQ